MNRNTLLGFTSGLVFVASLVIGLVAADSFTDQGGGEPRLPGALGDPIEVFAASPITDTDSDAPVDLVQPPESAQAGYVPVDSGSFVASGAARGSSGGGTTEGGDGTTDASSGDSTELTVAPLREDPFAPVEIDPLFEGLFTGDLFFEFLEFPQFRFLDFCADDTGLPGCPAGVGGTVLAPLGGGLESLGDFRLGATLKDASGTGSACGTPGEGDRPLFLWANHPAEFEITYHPVPSRAGPPTTLTVSNADFDHPEFLRFADNAAESRLATSPWPRECFILVPSDGPWTQYAVEVDATSFAGVTASKTYNVDIREGPRPPVVLNPLDDNAIRAFIPVKATQAATLSLVHHSDPTTCAEVEADGRFGEVLPAEESGILLDWGSETAYDEASPSWPYDPAYNRQRIINVIDLEEGSTYLVCIWWLESADRSFDGSVVVERERRWITTPNRLTAIVTAKAVQNLSGRALAADSYTVRLSCASELRSLTIPPSDMTIREFLAVPGDPTLCDYGGRQIRIPTTGSFVTPGGDRGEFALSLDPTSPRGFQTFEVNLSTEAEQGPLLIVHAFFVEGSDRGGDRWQTGTPIVFEPLPEEAEGLPSQIRIDTLTSGVDADGQDGLRVTAEFDRPVRLAASLLGEPCLSGADPSFASGGFRQTYSFRLDGLCLLTRYSVVLEVEDEAGNSAAFADVAPGLPEHPGATYFRGTGWTDGHDVAYTVWTAGGLGSSVDRYTVGINGVDFEMQERTRCLPDTIGPGPGAHTRTATDMWGEEVTVTVSFHARQRDRSASPGCIAYDDHRYDSWSANVTTTFTIAEFEAGDITIEFHPTDPRGGTPLEVVLVIRGRIRD